jgi:hypothetical protein
MLTEKEIYGCNIESQTVYWKCNNCIYAKQERCNKAFKNKLKAIGSHLLEIKQNETIVKIKVNNGYIGFKSKYDLQNTFKILENNKDKDYNFILSLF